MREYEGERQPLEEAVYDYRKKHPGPAPDFDAKFLLDTFHHVNESSKVLIGINTIVNGQWDKHANIYGITGVYVSDDHKLVFKVHRDRSTFEVDALVERINKAMKSFPYKHIPVAFELAETIHPLTDMFGHSLVNDMWAGLPFDIVLTETTSDVSKYGKKETAQEEQ